jgi:hypothetical protein
MEFSFFDKTDISTLENILVKDGELQIVPYEYLKPFSQNEISQFCVDFGCYIIPTVELLLFLQREIGATDLSKVMEIGAGHGAISRTLKIRAVDNFMQEKPEVRALYETMKQAIVPYGKHVEKIDGNEAIRKYKPTIVIGAYCTHKYNPNEHFRGGNALGFNEKLILERVQKYIHIGNKTVHRKKPILKYKYREIKEEWIVGRSQVPKDNVIWIWEK